MSDAHPDTAAHRNTHPAGDDPAASAGSESPEEGQAAMDAAKNATTNPDNATK